MIPDSDRTYHERTQLAIGLLRGKWTVQILCQMRTEAVRLSELTRALPEASKKSLTMSLRALEAAKIITRRDLSKTVLHVEYELAQNMRDLILSTLDCLADLGGSLS